MYSVTVALVALILVSTFWYLSALPRNFRNARKSGLPVYFCPVSQTNPLWLLIARFLGYTTLARIMPTFLFDALEVIITGWEHHSRYSVFQKRGVAFVLVTPGNNIVVIADPAIAIAVLQRRKDFTRLEFTAKMLSMFGENVVSASQNSFNNSLDGEEWQRHRRIVAPALNERIMSAVWSESSNQTSEMLQELTKTQNTNTSAGTSRTLEGLKTITINVISSIVFGTQRSWAETTTTKPSDGFQLSFIESLLTIVNDLVPVFLVPSRFFKLPFLSTSFRKVGIAKAEFPLHLRDTIAQERQSPSFKNALITSLIKLADQDKSIAKQSSKMSTYLSEEEITGNLFIFTIAGFDTTANTLGYAIVELALNPQLQDWIFEGIDETSREFPGNDYSSVFPLNTRCLALMFETLRIHAPAQHIARETQHAQQIKDIYFAPDTHVQVALAAIHVSPSIWGSDALSFRPDRWLDGGRLKCETLREPVQGTFLPWSAGPRYCPGIKMSQVEFVAVIKEIFGKWKVEVVQREGETIEAARERVQLLVTHSVQRLTLQVKNPEDVVLKWLKR